MPDISLIITPDEATNFITYNGNYRIFSICEPIKCAKAINGYMESVNFQSNDQTGMHRSFRYSADKLNWSLWIDFDPTNISALTSLKFTTPIFIDIKYYYNSTIQLEGEQFIPPIIITQFKFTLEPNVAGLPDNLTPPPVEGSDEFSPNIVVCRNPKFDPYALTPIVSLIQQLNNSVNNQFGHEVLYFRTGSSAPDYTFKEYTLQHVIDKKCIKVLVPNNQFPDNKPIFAEFGVDFEAPFEIHLDIGYFEDNFGKNAKPRKRDFMYFQKLNRVYEIQGSYPYRGIDMVEMYYRIQLVKYNPNIDMIMKPDAQQAIDDLIITTDELFKDKTDKEVKDAILPQQFNTTNRIKGDPRKSIDKGLVINDYNQLINWGPIINNYYDLSKMTNLVAINYNEPVKFSATDSLTFSSYFQLIGKTTGTVTFLDGSSGSPNFGIKITGDYNRTAKTLNIHIALNSQIKTYNLTNINFDSWYNLIIEISNEFQQIGVYVYLPVADLGMINNWTDFNLFFKKTESLTRTIIDTTDNYRLIKSDLNLANFRLFNNLLKEENHRLMMSMLVVKDEGQALIIDNMKKSLHIPYIGLNK